MTGGLFDTIVIGAGCVAFALIAYVAYEWSHRPRRQPPVQAKPYPRAVIRRPAIVTIERRKQLDAVVGMSAQQLAEQRPQLVFDAMQRTKGSGGAA